MTETKLGDTVKTWRWDKWRRGVVSKVHEDGTVDIEWHGGGVSLRVKVINGILPRRAWN